MAATIRDILAAAPVIPVLTIADAAHAVAIARALVAGGLPVIEVTLRTPAALDAIREMHRVPGALVGAGTVLDPGHLQAAADAGAVFIVSPGLSDRLAEAAAGNALPYLPGVATASEILRAREQGFAHVKFFPAESAGGIPALKALSAAFPDMLFCPTGGLTLESAQAWLDLPSVACVGGSWLVPAGQAVDPEAIAGRARQAAALRRR
jgi:2-dehydro-3-deoxyphosphogluconate aldolase/(4S)-4-hydroxy-2-oxoglutarate aldolase